MNLKDTITNENTMHDKETKLISHTLTNENTMHDKETKHLKVTVTNVNTMYDKETKLNPKKLSQMKTLCMIKKLN